MRDPDDWMEGIMVEHRLCAVCGAPLDGTGACPAGHAQLTAAPATPPAAPPPLQYAPPAAPPQYAPPPQYVVQPVYIAPPPRPPMDPADKWAVASFVCTGLMFLCSCCGGIASFLPALLGVIFGFLGLKGPRYKWMAIVSIVFGVLTIVAWVVLFILYGATMGLGMLAGLAESGSGYTY